MTHQDPVGHGLPRQDGDDAQGPVIYYVLFFIHLESRRVHLAGMTPNPDGQWMAQVARNMSMIFGEEKPEHRPTHIIRDRDTKFTAELCSILETDGIEFRPTPRQSPNLNAYAERFVQTIKQECLDHFIVFGENHLRKILSEWLTYYHLRRPHQGLGNVLISGEALPEMSIDDFRRESVVCHETLGGLLKHYELRAA